MAGEFRLDRLSRLDPARETRLAAFLGSPIDSRDPLQVVGRTLPTGTVPAGRRTQSELEREWDARFSRVLRARAPRTRPHRDVAGPTLVQRQCARPPDPLNRETVEDIAEHRSHALQGPPERLSRLPRLRHLPDGILSTPVKRANFG
jgi:hypothetical protein